MSFPLQQMKSSYPKSMAGECRGEVECIKKQESPLSSILAQLSDRITTMDNTIARLGERLDPVMVPDGPTCCGADKVCDKDVSSQVVNRLDDACANITRQIHILEEFYRRLQV